MQSVINKYIKNAKSNGNMDENNLIEDKNQYKNDELFDIF